MHGSLILYTIHCTHLYTYRSILYSLYPCRLFFVTRRKPLNLLMCISNTCVYTYKAGHTTYLVVLVHPPGGHLENLLRGAKLRGHQSKLVCLHINLIPSGGQGGAALLCPLPKGSPDPLMLLSTLHSSSSWPYMQPSCPTSPMLWLTCAIVGAP